MGIGDYIMADGIDVVGSGDGWSIWHELPSHKWRFDIFSEFAHRCCPALAKDMTAERAGDVVKRLRLDANRWPSLESAFLSLKAFVDDRWHG